MMRALSSAFKAKPWVFSYLVIILLVSAYFRLWNLGNTFHFLGDQGRDALVVSRIFTENDLVFIGPVTSVGNMYLGPFYYYFMLPFLYLSYPSPIGPVLAVAAVSILTVYLLYRWGQELVGSRAALISAGLMAISVTSINLSRFSWNPNIAPFISLAMMYSTYLAWTKHKRYWLLVGLCFSILIQLHYVTLLAGAAAAFICLLQVFEYRKNRTHLLQLLVMAAGALVIVALSLVPLLLFDYKHGWTNALAFKDLVSSKDNFVQQDVAEEVRSLWEVIYETHGRAMHILFEISIGSNRQLNTGLLLAVIGIVGFSLTQAKHQWSKSRGIIVVAMFLLISIIGLSFYQHSVFDHYIAFLFPATFLMLGFCLNKLLQIKWLGWIAVTVFVMYYLNYNLANVSLEGGGPTHSELQATANSIHQRVSDNEPYSIVLLSESRDLYGMNYRYYLSTVPNKQPLDPEEHGQAEKMFIINEDLKTDTPQNLPIYEIVVFENKQPQEYFTLPHGIKIMVLSKHGDN